MIRAAAVMMGVSAGEHDDAAVGAGPRASGATSVTPRGQAARRAGPEANWACNWPWPSQRRRRRLCERVNGGTPVEEDSGKKTLVPIWMHTMGRPFNFSLRSFTPGACQGVREFRLASRPPSLASLGCLSWKPTSMGRQVLLFRFCPVAGMASSRTGGGARRLNLKY